MPIHDFADFLNHKLAKSEEKKKVICWCILIDLIVKSSKHFSKSVIGVFN